MAVLNHKKSLQLILVDDHEMVREGLARSIEKEPDLKVIGQCSSSAEALLMLQGSVDMVLLDVDLGKNAPWDSLRLRENRHLKARSWW